MTAFPNGQGLEDSLNTNRTCNSYSSEDGYLEFEKLMLSGKYEEVLSKIDLYFNENDIAEEEMKGFRILKYGTVVYLNLILENEDIFLKYHDKICRDILKQHWNDAKWIRLDCKTAIYAKLGLPDTIIKECEDYIHSNMLDQTNYLAYISAAGALLVKKDIAKARAYIATASQILSEIHEEAKKNGRPILIDDGSDIMCKIFLYYIQHLSDSYRVELAREKPDPPKLIYKKGKPCLKLRL